MAIKFINPSEAVQKQGLKMLVYGPAGAGKTVLCATANEPTLIISAEAGLLSIKDAPNSIKIAEVKTRKEVEEVLTFLKTEGPPPWVCIDSISEVAETVLAEEMKNTKMAMKAYGELNAVMTDLIKGFRDLPNANVLMTCKQARSKDDSQGQMLYEPGMPGQKLGPAIPHYFDLVGSMRVFKDNDGNLQHWLQCNRDEQYDAKDRSGRLDLFEQPSLAAIKKKIEGKNITTPKKAA